MRQMTRLATVGAMSLALVGASASAALAGYHEFSSEETFTNIDRAWWSSSWRPAADPSGHHPFGPAGRLAYN